jgi:hypothetical protein
MTILFTREFLAPRISRIGDTALLIGIILAGTVFPRLMLLGLFPVTDDGYYAYVAQQIHHGFVSGQGVPDFGGLSFYPLLCSWVFSLQYNPMITLRLIDLSAAIIMAFLLYKVLARICKNNPGAALITFMFTVTMNDPVFIDNGFKNSITAAFVPLLLALYIGTAGAVQDKKSGKTWWMAGALTALAIVLRETFVPFAVLGLVSVLLMRGKKAALQFFAGGIATGIVLIGGILVARGGIAETVAAYRTAGIVFGSVPGDLRLENFIFYGLATIRLSFIVLAFSVLAIVILSVAIFLRRDRTLLRAVVFWLSFIAVALIEAVMKMSFPYHFTIAFPGLAGLCALALREIMRVWPVMQWMNGEIKNTFAVTGIILSAFWFYFSCSAWTKFYWPITLETLIAAPDGKWPEKFTNRSNYLFMAAEIKKVIPENGTLGISRLMHVLYPLTNHFSSSYRLSDLSALTISLNSSVPAIRQELLNCAPDVLVITTEDDWSTGGGSAHLLEAVLATGVYEAAVKIPVSERIHGYLSAIIFRKTQETVCLVKQDNPE